MKKPPSTAAQKRQDGYILFMTMMIAFCVVSVEIFMIASAGGGVGESKDAKNKARVFYASDGIMTMLAQEVLDGNVNRYCDPLHCDIGNYPFNPSTKGTHTLVNGVHTITGGGEDSSASKFDYFHFTCQEMNTSKMDISVRVVSLENVNVNSRAGIMIREDTTAASRYAWWGVIADDLLGFQYRKSPDTNWVRTLDKPQTVPVFLRLTRDGILFKGYTSTNGTTWTLQDSVKVSMTARCYAGLAVKSKKRTQSSTAVFDNLKGLSLGVENHTMQVNDVSVDWSMSRSKQGGFNITTNGYIQDTYGTKKCAAPLAQFLFPQASQYIYPDTIWNRVIYYDYHADTSMSKKSNPEFEPELDWAHIPPWSGPTYGMVKSDEMFTDSYNADYFNLPSLSKPKFLANKCWNMFVEKWFVPWESVKEKKEPAYSNISMICSGINDVTYDTAFKNMVIKDSLPFARVVTAGRGYYRFKRLGAHTTDSAFFPLDNKPAGTTFGKEGHLHNYSFAMEMHKKFTYERGLMFEFTGDDDVWLFINKKLVIDLGGLHNAFTYRCEFDTLGLTEGQEYPFDFFYCERKLVDSKCKITSNIEQYNVQKKKLAWKRDYGVLD